MWNRHAIAQTATEACRADGVGRPKFDFHTGDGAAEPIIDFALAHGKAFAIVPCCTCSKQFPHRRMNGAPVKSYESLVSYLLAKDPRIKKTRLDFDGRNACLYFRP